MMSRIVTYCLITLFVHVCLLLQSAHADEHADCDAHEKDCAQGSLKYRAVDFEVFGKVQGVYFRKYTKQKADSLNLVGWCKNTNSGTVKGTMQGNPDEVDDMKLWLQKTGSPQSQIRSAVFSEDREITKLDFKEFTIIRN